MNVQRSGAAAFVAEFVSEEELRAEHRDNLAFGALRLPTAESVPLHTALTVTLRGPGGAEADVQATVVAILPDALALAIEGDADKLLAQLLARPSAETNWDRIRGLSQGEKILLASKADRSDRAMLLQDNDPRVLLSVLRNPRLTADEVVRIAKSTNLTYQIADVIMKTGQWMASMDVRLALIQNARTPQAFALRILPTLPDSEVRNIARAGTSMALKTAALKQLQRPGK
jgi:hypothetical protein